MTAPSRGTKSSAAASIGPDERRPYRSFCVAMDTVITLEVLTTADPRSVRAAVARAAGWFAEIERRCSRFDPDSELRALCEQVGVEVTVSPVLFEAIQVALALAAETAGAFDPTIGGRMETLGFNRNFRTGESTPPSPQVGKDPSYLDVQINTVNRSLQLRRPITLDLGAIAKGMALDLANRELSMFNDVCLEAGGDIVARGLNSRREPWSIGIRDPRQTDAILDRWGVRDGAVCTSGDYERPAPSGDVHHLINPHTGTSAAALTSVTVAAPTALAADGLATAAFILGPNVGLSFLESQGVRGLMLTPDGHVITTPNPRIEQS